MRQIQGASELLSTLRCPVLTIGNFDGIHLGHRAILKTVVSRAQSLGGEAIVYTFDPHPRKVLRPEHAPPLLTTSEQKLELLAECGVDAVIVEPFTLEFAKVSADRFIREWIHARIRPAEIYVGYDFHFGRDREGSMRMLTETGPRLGISVTIIPEVTVSGGEVNSTRIRELLANGQPGEAAGMLGRAFSIRGSVTRGDQRGRELGFPTANVAPESELLPAAGVYTGHLRLLDAGDPPQGAELRVVINVGRRPTLKESADLVAEAHVIDWEGDLYGRRIDLSFIEALRAERKFPDVDALRAQIALDVAEARRRLRSA